MVKFSDVHLSDIECCSARDYDRRRTCVSCKNYNW